MGSCEVGFFVQEYLILNSRRTNSTPSFSALSIFRSFRRCEKVASPCLFWYFMGISVADLEPTTGSTDIPGEKCVVRDVMNEKAKCSELE